MKKVIKLLSIIVIVMSISFICYIKNNSTYQTVEKLTKKGNTIAFMLEQDDGSYQSTEELPTGYEFNPERSQCNNGAKPTWDKETKSLRLSITKKNTSCFLYFDKGESTKKLEELGITSQGITNNFTGTACKDSCDITDENGVYQAEDDYGVTYYYRGTVDNNWLKFGQTTDGTALYWRIIRINGDGTIRLIYGGEEESLGNGNGKNAVDSKAYNSSRDDNKYVGFMYGSALTPTGKYEDAHKNETKSNILNELETWWNGTNLNSLLDRIDGETGFCNDRQSYGSSSSSIPDITNKGYGTVTTYYGPYIRAVQARQPILKCAQPKQDLFTSKGEAGDGNGALETPVGLITADEVVYAGGYSGKSNNGYWLYTNQYYWTMSPYSFNGGTAYVFFVGTSGNLNDDFVNYTYIGVRPVINLKADAKLITNQEDKKGTIDNPYIVEGAG